MPFGLTITGFVKKTYVEVLDSMKTSVRAAPGMSRVNLDRDSLPGVVLAVAAAAVSEVWDVAQEIWTSWDPSASSGRALENVSKITGTRRERATATSVLANVNVDPGVYAAGSLLATVNGYPDRRFINRDEVVNAGGGAALITDVTFLCESEGPIACPSGSLTVIGSPVPGWNSITNPLDGVLGRATETDSELRRRREEELASGGGSTFDAMIADLRRVDGIVTVTVFENPTDVQVGALPPHSFEVLVYDGTLTGTRVSDAVIAAAIWKSKPNGIRTVGTSSYYTPGSDGLGHLMRFTRPTVVPIYLDVHVIQRSGIVTNPLDSCRESLLAYLTGRYAVGEDVVWSALFGPAYAPGIYDVTDLFIGLAPSPSGTANIVIDDHSIAVFDTSRITIS